MITSIHESKSPRLGAPIWADDELEIKHGIQNSRWDAELRLEAEGCGRLVNRKRSADYETEAQGEDYETRRHSHADLAAQRVALERRALQPSWRTA